ncbi:MAG: M14 family metallocarboxypeptidase [Gemmatimonadota bacterium]
MSLAPGDYDGLAARLLALSRPGLRRAALGAFHGYPVYWFAQAGRRARRRVLLASGTHGDEPAGPLAALRFLEREPTALVEAFDFWVLPCLNPWGYVHGTRANGDGVDINRSFEDASTPEAAAVRRLLRGERFDLLFEFHEDWEFEGYYLYEVRRGGALVGPRIVERVAALGPIHPGPAVDGYPALGGVIHPTPEVLERQQIGQKALPLYVYHSCADHVVTSETPSTWPLELRQQAQLAALEAALEWELSAAAF